MNKSLKYPVLYSFRRCPYAMRARMAIRLSGITYEHREILLKNKPKEMLELSPKGTVPVLITEEGMVIDESLDVMLWALEKVNHPLLKTKEVSLPWIEKNDTFFKPNLDRYKYPSRYLNEGVEDIVREKAYTEAEEYLIELDIAIGEKGGCVLAGETSLADIAIFPFIRQFSKVDEKKWHENNLTNLKLWLNIFIEQHDFKCIMHKSPLWGNGCVPQIISRKGG